MKVGESFFPWRDDQHLRSPVSLALIGAGLSGGPISPMVWPSADLPAGEIALIAEQTAASDSGLFETLTRHGSATFPIILCFRPAATMPQRRKEIIAQAISSLRGSHVEEIVVSADLHRWPELSGLLSELRVLPLPVNLVPAGPLSELFKLSSHTIGETVTIELQRGPRTLSQHILKRTFDNFIALAALISFLPVFLVAAIAIKLEFAGGCHFPAAAARI